MGLKRGKRYDQSVWGEIPSIRKRKEVWVASSNFQVRLEAR